MSQSQVDTPVQSSFFPLMDRGFAIRNSGRTVGRNDAPSERIIAVINWYFSSSNSDFPPDMIATVVLKLENGFREVNRRT